MDWTIRRTEIEELEVMLLIQKEAFWEDLEKYQDHKTSPATEPIAKLRYKVEKNLHYTIWIGNQMIGGAELRLDFEDECYINRIFLLPQYQHRGYGSQIMMYFEGAYPKVKKWTLCTPHLNFKSHHFYEKLGYQKVGEHSVTDKLKLIDYLKQIE